MSKIELDYEKNIYKNIEELYNKLKKIKEKKKAAIEALNNFLKKEGKKNKEKKEVVKEWKKQWFHDFNWSYTYKGKLIIGGKNKDQNELIFSKYFEENDLFFHADIIGGSVVILKKGEEADQQERIETAQFSVCFSKAWREKYSRLSSYCLGKEGVSKVYKGKKAEKGSFFIIGEREWYKNMQLSLRIGLIKEDLIVVPSYSKIELENEFLIKPGIMKKEKIVEELSKHYGERKDKISAMLPQGRFFIKKTSNI